MSVVEGPQWRKSSRSGAQQACVEVATNTQTPLIRDSKLGDESPILEIKSSAFRSFLKAVGDGKFQQ